MRILIRKLESAIKAAQKVACLAHLNTHFFTPQAVNNFFAGREKELDVLKTHLITSPSADPFKAQKRFVVFGLAGCGKTQFCCKFASDNKQRYETNEGDALKLRLNLLAFGVCSGSTQAPKSTQNNRSPQSQPLERSRRTKLLSKAGFQALAQSNHGYLLSITLRRTLFQWKTASLTAILAPYL